MQYLILLGHLPKTHLLSSPVHCDRFFSSLVVQRTCFEECATHRNQPLAKLCVVDQRYPSSSLSRVWARSLSFVHMLSHLRALFGTNTCTALSSIFAHGGRFLLAFFASFIQQGFQNQHEISCLIFSFLEL